MSDPVATAVTAELAPAAAVAPADPAANAPIDPRLLARAQAKGLFDTLWGMYTDLLAKNAKHISMIIAVLVIVCLILMYSVWSLMQKIPASVVGLSGFECKNDLSWKLPDGRGYSGEHDNQYGAAANFHSARAGVEVNGAEDQLSSISAFHSARAGVEVNGAEDQLSSISAFESTPLSVLDSQLVYAPFTAQTSCEGMYEGFADAVQSKIVNSTPGTTDTIQVPKSIVAPDELPWSFGKCSDAASPKVPLAEHSDEYLARRWSGRIL